MCHPCWYLIFLLLACRPPHSTGQPALAANACSDPDAPVACCFLAAPDSLGPSARLADAEEPGERLVITGRLLKPDGSPWPGVRMYVYHTDASGRYTRRGGEQGIQRWHGHLHGWLESGPDGRYEIRTIRPAPYPDADIPAHLHAAVWSSGEPYYINDFVFEDDPLVTPAYLRSLSLPGGEGVMPAAQGLEGWTAVRDIRLAP
ncbi:MAG: intradiol ring-cleavage dioxygenase [Bacteroidia bacterium]|nr:intradiol ring-cleavage dioxygenase [Bacteroidia bacterium]